jgi:hypothetical protein
MAVIFAWVTLGWGYSVGARTVTFGWLIFTALTVLAMLPHLELGAEDACILASINTAH